MSTPNGTHKLGLALDPAALNALRHQSRDMPQSALRAVAKQFEAIFVNMMLKSMRDATPQEGILDSDQTRMFTGMLDQQYAAQLAQGHGVGLADMLVKQLGRHLASGAGADSDPEGAVPSSHGAPGSLSATARRLSSQPAPGFMAGLRGAPDGGHPAVRSAVPDTAWREPDEEHPPAAPATDSEAGSRDRAAAAVTAAPYREPNAADFRAAMAPHAQAASEASGIPADFMIAQAGLESGWGRHQPQTADGRPSHNLFGIKAGAGWHGAVVRAATTEIVNGVPRRVIEPFRAYGSYAEAFHDYAALLNGSARYARVRGAVTAQAFAQGLQAAGYATDPAYAAKLQRAIAHTTDLHA